MLYLSLSTVRGREVTVTAYLFQAALLQQPLGGWCRGVPAQSWAGGGLLRGRSCPSELQGSDRACWGGAAAANRVPDMLRQLLEVIIPPQYARLCRIHELGVSRMWLQTCTSSHCRGTARRSWQLCGLRSSGVRQPLCFPASRVNALTPAR